MSKILYILDKNKKTEYNYKIEEDTIIYHFSINSSSKVDVKIEKDVKLTYYYNNINYDDNEFQIEIEHKKANSHSELISHGVNVLDNKLTYKVDGKVNKTSSGCICNQENQIINMQDGKSTICPNLLIDNYDVDSNHSAYIGKFRDEEIFYLMSRGIKRKDAYRLLLTGFLIETESLEFDKVIEMVEEIEKI